MVSKGQDTILGSTIVRLASKCFGSIKVRDQCQVQSSSSLSSEFAPHNAFSKEKMWVSGAIGNSTDTEFLLFKFAEPTQIKTLSFNNPTLLGSNLFAKVTTIAIDAGPNMKQLKHQVANRKFNANTVMTFDPAFNASVVMLSFNSTEKGIIVQKYKVLCHVSHRIFSHVFTACDGIHAA